MKDNKDRDEVLAAVKEDGSALKMFMAIYDFGNFTELASENKGYEFALSMLDNLKSINSKDDFSDFIDSLDI